MPFIKKKKNTSTGLHSSIFTWTSGELDHIHILKIFLHSASIEQPSMWETSLPRLLSSSAWAYPGPYKNQVCPTQICLGPFWKVHYLLSCLTSLYSSVVFTSHSLKHNTPASLLIRRRAFALCLLLTWYQRADSSYCQAANNILDSNEHQHTFSHSAH